MVPATRISTLCRSLADTVQIIRMHVDESLKCHSGPGLRSFLIGGDWLTVGSLPETYSLSIQKVQVTYGILGTNSVCFSSEDNWPSL